MRPSNSVYKKVREGYSDFEARVMCPVYITAEEQDSCQSRLESRDVSTELYTLVCDLCRIPFLIPP